MRPGFNTMITMEVAKSARTLTWSQRTRRSVFESAIIDPDSNGFDVFCTEWGLSVGHIDCQLAIT